MPQVQMPDGTIVDMPDTLTPELRTRLQDKLQGTAKPVVPQVNWDDPKHPGVAAPQQGPWNDVGTKNPPPAVPPSAGAGHDVGVPAPVTGSMDVGASKNEDALIKAYGYDPAKIKKSPMYRPGDINTFANSDRGYSGSILDRLITGATDPAMAIGQIGNHIFGSPETQDYNNLLKKIDQDKYERSKPPGMDIARGVGNMATTAGMIPAAGASMPGVVAGGAAMGALTPVDANEPDFWKAKAGQVATGAIAAPVAHTVLSAAGEAVQPLLGKAASFVSRNNPENLSAELMQKAANLPYEDIDEIRAAANGVGPRAKAAAALMDQIQQAQGDMPRVMQTSIGIRALKAKMASDAQFALRNQLAEGVQVDVSHPLKVIDDILAEAGPDGSKWPEAERQNLLPELRKLRENLANTSKTTETPLGGLLDEHGNPLTKTTTTETPNTFKAISKTKSDLNDVISGYYKGTNAVVGEKGAANLQRVNNAIEKSLHDAAQNSGNEGLAAADRVAREGYAKMSRVFRDKEIVGAMTDSNPDTILPRFDGASKDRAMKLFNALDPKGKAAAMSGIADRGLKAMTDADGDPNAWARSMKQQKEAIGVFFKGADADKINGIKNLITGTDLVTKGGFPLAGALLGQATSVGTMGGLAAGEAAGKFGGERKTREFLNFLLTSKPSADFLTKLATLTPESSTTTRFIQNNLPKIVANYQTHQAGMQRFQDTTNPPEQPSPVVPQVPK